MTDYKRKELTFDATIMTSDLTVDEVLCRVYLPVRVADEIEIQFYPNKEQTDKLYACENLSIFSIKGEIKGYEDEIQQTIHAEKVLFRELNVDKRNLSGMCLDLRITHHLNHTHLPQVLEGYFSITHNPLVKSSFIFRRSRLGEISFEKPRNFKFKIDEHIELTFEDVFQNSKNERGDEVNFFETIVSFQIDGETNECVKFFEVYEKLQDILLLASFAARQRCDCFGWTTFDTKDDITQYLRHKSKPKDNLLKRKYYYGDGIIDIAVFEEFMSVAYDSFVNFPDKNILRRVLNFTIPNERTVESNFVALYAALEMLVSFYRKSVGLEFILNGSQFNKIRKSIKKHIEALDFESDQKQMMQEKLSELNRVSFVTAFEAFCKNYAVDLQDVWTVAGKSTGLTLSHLRNKLVHGEHFSKETNRALIVAKDHLQWAVERMILGVLKFPVAKSEICPTRLGYWTSYTDWNKHQEILTK